MLEKLREQQTSIVLQRSQAKDAIEQFERALGQINAAIQALEADAKERADAATKAEVVPIIED